MDKKFVSPEIEVIKLDDKDVITTSFTDSGYEGEWDGFEW